MNKMAAMSIYGTYSIRDSRYTKFVRMMRLGWPLNFLWYGQICVPVALAIMDECCMAFVNMQWLFLPGDRIVAHVPLV